MKPRLRPGRGARWGALALVVVLFACEESNTRAPGGPAGGGGAGGGESPPPTSTEAPALDRAIFPAEGATEFLTANEQELLSSGARGGANARGELDADADFAGAAEGADPGAPPAPGEAVPDPSREIVEADVFRLEGDRLYVLNRYRGLVIIDVADPDRLRVLGRLPFQAVPVEMYVRDGRAYVINSDYFVYWQYDPDADPHGFHGSQVMIVDVEDPRDPVLLGSQAIEGEVTDTRMVGDVLYTVSKRRPEYWRYNTADWEDRTWIASLDIADPDDIREIDRITFQGTSTLIHVAHHAIFVAAHDPNIHLVDPDHEAETLVTYVDISDPGGDLRERGRLYVPGYIADKFKMDWHEGTFRVLTQRWRNDANITLHVVSTAAPDTLRIDASLELQGVPQSGLLATRFAGPRAFAMTHEWVRGAVRRKLHTLDLGEPLAPRQVGALALNLDITHFEVHGDRLLAMGRHGDQRRSAVALFDIADLAAPVELATTPLGAGYSHSEANHDYKAFKTFPDLGLVLVPLNFWSNDRSFAGVQLVDWANDTLVERGRVENPGGVRRAFPVGERLLAVGELSIAAIDATDRARPRVTDALHLVRQVHDVFDIRDHRVELVTDVYSRGVRLEVREFGAADHAAPAAVLELPFVYAPYVLPDGDALHLIGYGLEGGQRIRNADLSNPRAPRLRGDLLLVGDLQRIHSEGHGYYTQYWSPYAGLPLRNQILPVTYRRVVETASGRRDFESELRFLDLRDLDTPRLADGAVPMNDFPFVNKVTHGDVIYSTHVEQGTTPAGDSLLYHVRCYVDRVDVSDPDAPRVLPSVNVPGYLVDASDDGTLLYTVDFQWDDFGRRRNSLNVLRIEEDGIADGGGAGAVARLVTVIPVPDQIHRAALRPGRLSDGGRPAGWHDRTIWLTAHKYPWWGVRSDTVASRQPYTILTRYDFSRAGTLAAEARSSLHGYHFDLLDVEGDRAYLASRGPTGLLVLDVADAAAPVIEQAARTLGYLSRIIVRDGKVYTPMGMFGVHAY